MCQWERLLLGELRCQGGERQPFSGTPQQIVEDIHRCQEIGIAELRLSTIGADITAVTQTWERFAHEVKPKV
jgi:hypothetical protein